MDYLHILSRIQVIVKLIAHQSESISLVMVCILLEFLSITFVPYKKHLTKRQGSIAKFQKKYNNQIKSTKLRTSIFEKRHCITNNNPGYQTNLLLITSMKRTLSTR